MRNMTLEQFDYRVNSSRTAAVSTDVYWRPIDANTPRNVRMMVINKADGISHIMEIGNQTHFDHWSPLPTWRN